MLTNSKARLPRVLQAIKTRFDSLFLQKLFLYKGEEQAAINWRHYDHQCEAVMSLANFLQRKILKNKILAIQTLKEGKQNLNKQNGPNYLRLNPKKNFSRKFEVNAPQSNKYVTRANTMNDESDTSLIFSPKLWKTRERNCKTQCFDSSINLGNQRTDILQNLLTKVKSINMETSQRSLKPQKTYSNFNVTLGRQSTENFQRNVSKNYQFSNHYPTRNPQKQSKNFKRQRILERFLKIERKIYENSPLDQTSKIVSGSDHKNQKFEWIASINKPIVFCGKFQQGENASTRQKCCWPGKAFNKRFSDQKNNLTRWKPRNLSSSMSAININSSRQIYV